MIFFDDGGLAREECGTGWTSGEVGFQYFIIKLDN